MKLPEIIELMLIAAISWTVLTGCTSHTKYHTTDGTRTTTFERTTIIGSSNATE